MADPKKIYWDSCIWLCLINGEQPWASHCKALIELAKQGKVQIWTSSFTLAEVYKTKMAGLTVELAEERDSNFEEFIAQDYLVEVQVDHEVGVYARRLLRKNPELKKPGDAIHLATAALNNVDELHTIDAVNLLPLDGRIDCRDGKKLRICNPTAPSEGATSDFDSSQMDLLDVGDKSN